MHHEERHLGQSFREMQRRASGVQRGCIRKRADQRVGVVTLEPVTALGEVGEVGHRIGDDGRGRSTAAGWQLRRAL